MASQVAIDLQGNSQAPSGHGTMRANALNEKVSLNTLKKQINNKFVSQNVTKSNAVSSTKEYPFNSTTITKFSSEMT